MHETQDTHQKSVDSAISETSKLNDLVENTYKEEIQYLKEIIKKQYDVETAKVKSLEAKIAEMSIEQRDRGEESEFRSQLEGYLL